jgi:ferredoxin--NADP+ reductase
MLRTYRGQDRWRRFIVLHGVRHARELAYRDEFEQAAREDPSVLYVPMATREPDDGPWTGRRGRVQSVLDDGVSQEVVGGELDPASCHVFLCGNPLMIDETEKLLQARGFTTHTACQPGNIHFERYW